MKHKVYFINPIGDKTLKGAFFNINCALEFASLRDALLPVNSGCKNIVESKENGKTLILSPKPFATSVMNKNLLEHIKAHTEAQTA